MSPLLSILEKESQATPNQHGHHEQEKNDSGKDCEGGHCACTKPCAGCRCRDKKER